MTVSVIGTYEDTAFFAVVLLTADWKVTVFLLTNILNVNFHVMYNRWSYDDIYTVFKSIKVLMFEKIESGKWIIATEMREMREWKKLLHLDTEELTADCVRGRMEMVKVVYS